MSKNYVQQMIVEAHLCGNIAWIDMLWVPPDQRGQGVGRGLYEHGERSLPAHLRLVRLMAADASAGRSDAFWDAMGFEYVYDSAIGELDYEDAQQMRKGVNGWPTPGPESVQSGL